jgi:hypothetical protein
MARLSGDSGVEGGEAEKAKAKGHRKKKSWSVGVNVNLARFSAGKGVREII